jgi:hypothetical protein
MPKEATGGSMKPNEEQIKKFWEWCGFRLSPYQDAVGILYDTPDGLHCIGLPPTDLNNLFKWAVPKLKAWTLGSSYPDKKLTLCLVSMGDKGGEAEAEDPAGALFWAISKVIEGLPPEDRAKLAEYERQEDPCEEGER